MPNRSKRAFILTVALALVACDSDGAKTAERTVSPLIGTWTRDGDVPKPNPKDPEFTKLTFAPDGTLAAQYVAAGGALAGVIGKAPKIESERDSYETHAGTTLRIAEGSSYREYAFRIADGKLYLTPSGGSDGATFSKSGAS
jgi:hypothetical protein